MRTLAPLFCVPPFPTVCLLCSATGLTWRVMHISPHSFASHRFRRFAHCSGMLTCVRENSRPIPSAARDALQRDETPRRSHLLHAFPSFPSCSSGQPVSLFRNRTPVRTGRRKDILQNNAGTCPGLSYESCLYKPGSSAVPENPTL